jgi:hypothetical protein
MQEDLHGVVRDILMTHQEYRMGRFIYVFMGVTEEQTSEGVFIRGTMAKIRGEYFAEYFDRERWIVVERRLPGLRSEEKSNFFVMPDGIMVFEERKPFISVNIFTKVLRGFAKDVRPTLGVLIVTPIGETTDVVETVMMWDGVNEVRFSELMLSNPEAHPLFERMEDVLENANADKAAIDFKNEEGALNMEESSIIRSGIELCGRGYGDYRIVGEERGEKVEITKRQRLVKRLVSYETLDDLLQIAVDFWNEIIRRVRNQ